MGDLSRVCSTHTVVAAHHCSQLSRFQVVLPLRKQGGAASTPAAGLTKDTHAYIHTYTHTHMHTYCVCACMCVIQSVRVCTNSQYLMCAVLAEVLLFVLDFFSCVYREHKRLEKSVPEKKKELSQCEEELASLVAVESKLATQLKGLRAQAEEGRSSLEAFRSRCGHTQHTCTHTHTHTHTEPPITPSPTTLMCQPDHPSPSLPLPGARFSNTCCSRGTQEPCLVCTGDWATWGPLTNSMTSP